MRKWHQAAEGLTFFRLRDCTWQFIYLCLFFMRWKLLFDWSWAWRQAIYPDVYWGRWTRTMLCRFIWCRGCSPLGTWSAGPKSTRIRSGCSLSLILSLLSCNYYRWNKRIKLSKGLVNHRIMFERAWIGLLLSMLWVLSSAEELGRVVFVSVDCLLLNEYLLGGGLATK